MMEAITNAWCTGCRSLLGRVTSEAHDVKLRELTAKHVAACGGDYRLGFPIEWMPSVRGLIAAQEYAEREDNEEPDPAAVLSGAIGAHLTELGLGRALLNAVPDSETS